MMNKKTLLLTCICVGTLLPSISGAEDLGTLDAEHRLAGKELRKAFTPVQAVLNKHSVAIFSGSNASLYATIVSSDGYLLTKASDFLDLEDISLRIGREKFSNFTVVAYDEMWDLLLLKIEANDLSPIVCEENADLSHGTWVVSNGGTTRRERRIKVGVIAANTRVITSRKMGGLGVSIDGPITAKGLEVGAVTEKSGAKNAGILEGDFILKIGDFAITEAGDLKDALIGRKPGTFLEVEISRQGEKITLSVELMSRAELFKEEKKLSKNDVLSGRVSSRRVFFPRAIQHATSMSVKNIGGPLLTLEGKCVGMNIANANRSENFAIPARELKGMIAKLIQEAKKNGNQPIDSIEE